jgi:hypothetical protein
VIVLSIHSYRHPSRFYIKSYAPLIDQGGWGNISSKMSQIFLQLENKIVEIFIDKICPNKNTSDDATNVL